MLVGLIVAIFLILLVLGVAAPKVAQVAEARPRGGGRASWGPICAGDTAVLPEDAYLSGVDRAVGEDEQYTVSAAAVCGPDDGQG